jgi:hypothetical protein
MNEQLRLEAIGIRDRLFNKLSYLEPILTLISIYNIELSKGVPSEKMTVKYGRYDYCMKCIPLAQIDSMDINDARRLKQLIEANHDINLIKDIVAKVNKFNLLNKVLDDRNFNKNFKEDAKYSDVDFTTLDNRLYVLFEIFQEINGLFEGDNAGASTPPQETPSNEPIVVPDEIKELFFNETLAKHYYAYCKEFSGDNDRITKKYNEYVSQGNAYCKHGHKKKIFKWLNGLIQLSYTQFCTKLE